MTAQKGPWELCKEPPSDPSQLLSPFWQKVGDIIGTVDLIVSLVGRAIYNGPISWFSI